MAVALKLSDDPAQLVKSRFEIVVVGDHPDLEKVVDCPQAENSEILNVLIIA